MAVWMRNVLLAALAVATLVGNVGRLAAWVENVERLRGSWAGRDYPQLRGLYRRFAVDGRTVCYAGCGCLFDA